MLNLAWNLGGASMRRTIICVCITLAALLSLGASAQAETKAPKSVLVEAARVSPGGRGIQVVVGQAELGSNIKASDIAIAGGVLVDAKIEADRGKRNSVGITPLRTA